MFRRRFPRLIWRGDFVKDKELTRKPRGHESDEFVNRVLGKTKVAPTTVPGQSGKSAQADLTCECRWGGGRDENERPFTVQPGWRPALLEICWVRAIAFPLLGESEFR